MKVAMITTSGEAQAPRLGLGIGPDSVLDVGAVASLANGRAPSRRPEATTLKDLLAAGQDEQDALRAVADWAETLDLEDARREGFVHTFQAVQFHAPISDPEKFLCVGKNYRAHLDELVRTDLIREIPEEPTGFIKLNSVIAGHGDAVERPRGIVQFDYEPELAFVIGRPAHGVSRDKAYEHVFGVTLFNDLTAREIQRREVKSGTRFWTAKNMPNFGPIGPFVVTLDEAGDVNDLEIECRVNGEHRMRFNTSGQIFKIPDIIEHFSRYIPLRPGDLFATGSASGVAVGQENADELFLRPGDRVEVVLDGVMTLANTIVEDYRLRD